MQTISARFAGCSTSITAKSGRVYALLFALTLILLVPHILRPLTLDDAVYRLVGAKLAQGAVLYRDAWDQKPPYLYLWYGIFAVIPAIGTFLNVICYALVCAAAPYAVYVAAKLLRAREEAGLVLALIALLACRAAAAPNVDFMQAGFCASASSFWLGFLRHRKQWSASTSAVS
jgi:hypothetical protein